MSSNAEDLRQKMERFRDADGLVSPHPSGPEFRNSSGNGLLYTAQYMFLLHRRNDLNQADREEYTRIIKSCQAEPGLFKRGPIHPDQQSHDDYTWILLSSWLIDTSWAKEILGYGRRHFWIWHNGTRGNLNEYWQAFLGKNQALYAHMRWCAGEQPSFIQRWIWRLALDRTDFADGDSCIMSYALAHVGLACADKQVDRDAGKMFFERLGTHRPQGIRECLHGREHNHPMIEYWPARSDL